MPVIKFGLTLYLYNPNIYICFIMIIEHFIYKYTSFTIDIKILNIYIYIYIYVCVCVCVCV